MNLAKHHAKALQKKREGRGNDFLIAVDLGERAREMGRDKSTCPYPAGSDMEDAWLFGFEG